MFSIIDMYCFLANGPCPPGTGPRPCPTACQMSRRQQHHPGRARGGGPRAPPCSPTCPSTSNTTPARSTSPARTPCACLSRDSSQTTTSSCPPSAELSRQKDLTSFDVAAAEELWSDIQVCERRMGECHNDIEGTMVQLAGCPARPPRKPRPRRPRAGRRGYRCRLSVSAATVPAGWGARPRAGRRHLSTGRAGDSRVDTVLGFKGFKRACQGVHEDGRV